MLFYARRRNEATGFTLVDDDKCNTKIKIARYYDSRGDFDVQY
jgi:hypothetical protein